MKWLKRFYPSRGSSPPSSTSVEIATTADENDPHFEKNIAQDLYVTRSKWLKRSQEIAKDFVNDDIDQDDYFSQQIHISKKLKRRHGKESKWPEELKQLYCTSCGGFYRKFKYENLHASLQSLRGLDLCITGYGSHFLLAFGPIKESDSETRFHLIPRIVKISEYLASAAAQLGWSVDDMFTQTASTRLVVTDGLENVFDDFEVERESGLTVHDAVKVIAQACY